MSSYMKANRCGWDINEGWKHHKWICCKCSKEIKTVFKDLKGNDYCLRCFPEKRI